MPGWPPTNKCAQFRRSFIWIRTWLESTGASFSRSARLLLPELPLLRISSFSGITVRLPNGRMLSRLATAVSARWCSVDSRRIAFNSTRTLCGRVIPKEWNNPDAQKHLAEIRRLVLEKEDYVAADAVCQKMQGPYNQSYLPLADLYLTFEDRGSPMEYRRDLDLDRAVASVSYRAGGVRYTRHVFISAVDQVIVVRLEASESGKLSFTGILSSPVRSRAEASAKGLIRLMGKAPSHVDPNYVRSENPVLYDPAEGKGMRFEALLKVQADGGKVSADRDALRVEHANLVTLFIGGQTGSATSIGCRISLPKKFRAMASSKSRQQWRGHTSSFSKGMLSIIKSSFGECPFSLAVRRPICPPMSG